MNKKQIAKFIIICITVFIFLAFVINLLFKVHTNNLFSAEWSAGDALAYVGSVIGSLGTFLLGYSTFAQSKKANEINERLNEMQKEEYIPILKATGLFGVSQFETELSKNIIRNDVFLTKMITDDGRVILGHAISLFNEDCDLKHKNEQVLIPRTYELHFKYLSKSLLTSIKIKKIAFEGENFFEEYIVDKTIDVSMNNEEELALFIYYFHEVKSLQKYLDCSVIKCTKIKLSISLYTFSGKEYSEDIDIIKAFVKEKTAKYKFENIELFVSSSFKMNDTVEE